MVSFFALFKDLFLDLIGILRSIPIEGFGITTSFFDVLFAMIVIGMVISIFWKGARD